MARSLTIARAAELGAGGINPRDGWGAGRLSPEAEARFIAGVEYCGRFFMGMADAQKALYKLTAILEEEGVPYAIIGAFALNEYGHRRVTVGVDLVMRDADLQAFKGRHLGKGYAERVPGTGKLLDTEHGVDIDVLSTGRFPGDDKPKRRCRASSPSNWIPGCADSFSTRGSSLRSRILSEEPEFVLRRRAPTGRRPRASLRALAGHLEIDRRCTGGVERECSEAPNHAVGHAAWHGARVRGFDTLDRA